jgi:hypothetical protein
VAETTRPCAPTLRPFKNASISKYFSRAKRLRKSGSLISAMHRLDPGRVSEFVPRRTTPLALLFVLLLSDHPGVSHNVKPSAAKGIYNALASRMRAIYQNPLYRWSALRWRCHRRAIEFIRGREARRAPSWRPRIRSIPPFRNPVRTVTTFVEIPRDLAERLSGLPQGSNAHHGGLLSFVGLQVRAVAGEPVPVHDVANPLAIGALMTQRVARTFADRLTLLLMGNIASHVDITSEALRASSSGRVRRIEGTAYHHRPIS